MSLFHNHDLFIVLIFLIPLNLPLLFICPFRPTILENSLIVNAPRWIRLGNKHLVGKIPSCDLLQHGLFLGCQLLVAQEVGHGSEVAIFSLVTWSRLVTTAAVLGMAAALISSTVLAT